MKNDYFPFISCLLIFFLASFSRAIDPPHVLFDFIFSNEYYGPFSGSEEGGLVDITFSYRYTQKTSYQKVYEVFEYRNKQGMMFYRSYSDYHTLTKDQEYQVSLKFPVDHYLIEDLINVSFGIYSDDQLKNLYSRDFTLYKKTPLSMKPLIDNQEVYETTKNILGFNKTELYGEKFDFGYISESFPNNDYYELKIDNQLIKYNCVKPFVYKEAYLSLTDNKNIFPKIPKRMGNVIRFPLKIHVSNKDLTFSFKDIYFVDPTSLEIYTSYQQGTKMTPRLYLPIGRKDDVEGQVFTIRIIGAGYNESTIEYNLTYYSSNNLFGYCKNSDYCVKGENIDG